MHVAIVCLCLVLTLRLGSVLAQGQGTVRKRENGKDKKDEIVPLQIERRVNDNITGLRAGEPTFAKGPVRLPPMLPAEKEEQLSNRKATHGKVLAKLGQSDNKRKDFALDPPTNSELIEISKNPPPGKPKRVGFPRSIGTRAFSSGFGETESACVHIDGFSGGLRFHLSNFYPANDETFSLINPFNDVEIWSYDNNLNPRNGELWTPILTISEGEEVCLHVGREDGLTEHSVPIIKEVIYILNPPHNTYIGTDGGHRRLSHCNGVNEDCVEGAGTPTNTCHGGSAVNDARYAVARIDFGGGFICSGGLISNDSNKVYFLTANHCLSDSVTANSVTATFQYTTPDCGGTGTDGDCNPVSNAGTVTGASLVATGASTDFTLLELDSAPPAGSVYLGWNSAPVSDGDPLYRIHHPRGSPQAYSEHDVDYDFGFCTTLPFSGFIYSEDTFGANEGGSSGSPVVNGNGEIVGQLYGVCGFNLETCDSSNNRSVDGSFAATFPTIEPFLLSGTSPTPVPPTPGKSILAPDIVMLP